MIGTRLMHWILCSLLVLASVAGCASDDTTGGESGSLNLNLELADGIVINEVDWTLTGNEMPPMSGTIDTSAPGATASVEVFGLLPGTGYLVALEATSDDGKVTCRGSAEFDVEVGVSTDVMVMLNCKKPQTLGGVRVNGKFNICAELAKAVVSPLQTSIGNDISLSAEANDAENDPITYSWTGDGGSIADPSAANTTYTCEDLGDHMLIIQVTDNDEYCDMATWSVLVTCVEGDGVECESDEDCQSGEVCVDNECVADVECESDEDCADGEVCVDNECVAESECNVDEDCSDDNQCTISLCVDQACSDPQNQEAGADCDQNGGSVCDGNGACVQCNVDDDCASGETCSGGVCMVMAECAVDADCPQDGTGECSANICVSDMCAPDDVAAGEPCTGGVCNGTGDCVECNSADQCPSGGECQVPTCESSACGLTNAADGVACGDGGECVGGECQESDPVIAEGSGSTEWRANTTPGGGGIVPPTTGGCEVEVTSLSTTIALEVVLTLDAASDGLGNLTTGYTITAQNVLLGALTQAAQYAALEILTSITSGNPATVTNLANPAATGQFIGAFISGGVLTLATPNEILPNTEAVVPTSAPTVDVNWSGEFSLTLDVYTNGTYAFSLVVDESVCAFDGIGDPITFDVN